MTEEIKNLTDHAMGISFVTSMALAIQVVQLIVGILAAVWYTTRLIEYFKKRSKDNEA